MIFGSRDGLLNQNNLDKQFTVSEEVISLDLAKIWFHNFFVSSTYTHVSSNIQLKYKKYIGDSIDLWGHLCNFQILQVGWNVTYLEEMISSNL